VETSLYSHHWIATGWLGERWDFQNNEKTMDIILITGARLDGMENGGIFKTMKRQWNILNTGSRLDGMENKGIFKTMKRQWTFSSLDRDWMAWRTVGFSKQ
jgi:hypothetical protein